VPFSFFFSFLGGGGKAKWGRFALVGWGGVGWGGDWMEVEAEGGTLMGGLGWGGEGEGDKGLVGGYGGGEGRDGVGTLGGGFSEGGKREGRERENDGFDFWIHS